MTKNLMIDESGNECGTRLSVTQINARDVVAVSSKLVLFWISA